MLDVWQANDEGFYDVQQKGIQPDFNLRGVFRTGADGRYWFRAVKPKFYPIPDDGPVGKLLKALGRHPYRPAHLHFILKADGFETLTTHIFDPDDPYIHSDAVFGVKESLLADFRRVDDPKRATELGFNSPVLGGRLRLRIGPVLARWGRGHRETECEARPQGPLNGVSGVDTGDAPTALSAGLRQSASSTKRSSSTR